MDLVDIDQVLDNLELIEQEEEQQKAALLQASAAAASNGLKTNNTTTTSTALPANAVTNTSSTATKTFVGVSQVFTSLDDYQKNVELLQANVQKYDEECRALSGEQSGAAAKAETSTKSKDSDDGVKPNCDGDDDNEASSDIHKFKETQRKRLDIKENDINHDYSSEGSLSDSLTTSSSSTFSSGPSLGGIGSTVEEQSIAVTSENEEDEQHSLLNDNSEEPVQPITGETHCNSTADGNKGESLDDIAKGLSSISLTTANTQSLVQCEGTVSSALNNVLEDLETETQSTSLLSQKLEHIPEPKASVANAEPSVAQSEPGANEPQPDDMNEASNQLLQAANEIMAFAQQPKQTQQLQQPITFCSTMDDISDTELDSMLQEMEIDEEQVHNSNQVAENLPTIAEKTEDAVEPDNNHVPDCTNADSFSQASTVEFSEVKAQTVSGPMADDPVQSSNSIVSSYSSTESSLDEQIAVNGTSTNAQDDENLRPQRPTSLDIPQVNASVYTNAGQTPPGLSTALQHETSDDNLVPTGTNDAAASADNNLIAEASGYSDPHENLGKMPPIWVPDNMASGCMQCSVKFTVLKRRHHCRACGKVLCSACCSQKFKLEFLQEPESRVCVQCFLILMQRQHTTSSSNVEQIDCAANEDNLATDLQAMRSPNPNNPMEYCSTIPPHRQVSAVATPPPSVIVPVGVLKKDGSYSSNSSNSSSKQGRKRKSVMFSDGIAPGSDLASSLEQQWGEAKQARRGHQAHGDKQQQPCMNNKPATPVKNESARDLTTMGLVAQLFRGALPPTAAAAAISATQPTHARITNVSTAAAPTATTKSKSSNKQEGGSARSRRIPPAGCDENGCFIPKADDALPPLYVSKNESITDFEYKEIANSFELLTRLQRETLVFAIKANFLVHVKIVNLKCCMNRTVINFTTSGMHHVGNDEIVILLEYEPPASKEQMLELPLPRDVFVHLYEIYREAELGRPIAELSYTCPLQANLFGSRDYGGFMFIRITFQCLQDIIVPENPFLVGILIHRHEVPWAKVFPLRLMLRLGAQYRYYPCPHISIRNRESVYAEIAQTIINFLADFRHYTYTLPTIRGMHIHMEDRQTTVMIPRNRLDDVIKAINNASDHILALGGNFSKTADGHLVCMQNTNDDKTEMYAYSTQAINIQGQPRKVTGASFIVLNEALKSSSGLSGKCSIVEDGLMVQIMPTKMEEVRNALRNQDDINIVCGPLDAEEQQTEIVTIKWVDNDRDFNIGVKSPIDGMSMEGISSMRVHASFNYSNANYAIRLTDIFIIKFDTWYSSAQETLNSASLDITRIAEQIARSASMALVPFLDLLAASGSTKMALRATLHQENVCYEAGAQGAKLPPLYMNALDNHLIPTLHNESTGIEDAIVLELIFYILNV